MAWLSSFEAVCLICLIKLGYNRERVALQSESPCSA